MSRLNELLQTDSETKKIRLPVQEALPIRIDPEGAREAVLLLHGFGGIPGELEPLAQGLASAGYAVYAPRYPGHGTCRRDFLQTRAEDWTRRAYDAYLELRAEYEVVHVAGHSMGGLLASSIAISFGAPKLILLAPAFEISIKYMNMTPLIARFWRVIPQNRPLSAFDMQSPARKALQPDYWADVMVAPAAELMRLNRLCRRNLKRLKSHTLLILGECDQTIPTHVAEYLLQAAPRAASFETHIIEDASHLFPFNEYAPETVRTVLEWMASKNE